ncbi:MULTISPECIES: hypothetical protein [unclassified Paraflavitalea]|uniref:hypothetical protein n=1 Tax=unclassified Paraflavitalea TaxID=2798305 RepID=UPI003D3489BD
MKFLLSTLLLIAGINGINAQGYQAVHGSSYIGSLNALHNPASIVNVPSKWELAIFGVQGKAATNIVRVENFSIFSPASNSEYQFLSGDYKRKANAQANINLLNGRVAIGKNSAFSFGANIRTYNNLKTSGYNFIDTLDNIGQFIDMNTERQPFSLNTVSSGWLELFAGYGRTVYEDAGFRLNAGANLKLMRGVFGNNASLINASVTPVSNTNPTQYDVRTGAIVHGYSYNFDQWNKNNSNATNIRNFYRYSLGGFAFDLGAELLFKSQAIGSVNDEDSYYDYDLKLGVAIVDIGFNQFKYGKNSVQTSGIRAGTTNVVINQKMAAVDDRAQFNDSLATLVTTMSTLKGFSYKIYNPTRINLNADYFINGAWYINADLTVNVAKFIAGKNLYVKDLSLFSITPRWETNRFGAYLPLHVTQEGNFWVGAAGKIGPLVIGLHNLGYIFSQKSIQNGGFYMALIIKSGGNSENRGDRRLNCPPRKQ